MVSDRVILNAILGAIGELAYKLTGEQLAMKLPCEDGSKVSVALYHCESWWITPPGVESLLSDSQESLDKLGRKPTSQNATEKEQKQSDEQ